MTRVTRTFAASLEAGEGRVNLLLYGAGNFGSADTDKAEVLSLLAWVFRSNVPWASCLRDRTQGEEQPAMEKCQVRNLLRNLNTYKSVAPTWATSWGSCLASLWGCSYHLWEAVGISYSLVSLVSVPCKIKNQLLLGTISRNVKEMAIGNSQRDYTCKQLPLVIKLLDL